MKQHSIGKPTLVIWVLTGLVLWGLRSNGSPLARRIYEKERVEVTEPREQEKPADSIEDFRICRAEPNIPYFCNGPAYNEFCDHMEAHILELDRTKHKPPLWGRRSSPSPLANKSILFFGNSHTQQLFQSLACQYQAEQISRSGEYTSMELVLPNNVRVISITNHFLLYSLDWATLLKDATGGYGLEDFDAIVLGRFNDKSNSKGTNFEKWMREFSANQTGNISFDEISPPSIQQIADAFPKDRPIVLTSMFSRYSEEYSKNRFNEVERIVAVSREQQQPPGGRRIPMVDARAYVKTLGECGADKLVNGDGECHFEGEVNATRLPSSMHRCMGPRGGHPTLAVWDVIEELHRVLIPMEKKQSTSREQDKPQVVLPKDPIEDFRLCRAEPNIPYFCNGPAYNEFSDRMRDHILELNRTKHKPPLWGRRSSPSPLANKSILFFGNSHTRQLFQSLACQYQAEQVSRSGEYFSMELVLPNNVKVISITNHFLIHSPDWATLLKDATGGYGLEDFDAIVLGRFNDKSNSEGTDFEKWIKEHSTDQTGKISFDNTSPPSIQQIADAFPKDRPIVLTSMFSRYSEEYSKNRFKEVDRIVAISREQQQPPGGRRIPMVDARAYVKALGECGNDQVDGGGTCHSEGEPGMHRCTGPRGGHPSLVMWDVIEELHRVLVGEKL
jgi:hypothetical protein